MGTETVRVERRFQASAELVFDAWFDPDVAGRFLFATPYGTMQEVDVHQNGFRIVERRGDRDFAHVGRYLRTERPRLLRFALAAGVDGEPLSPETTVHVDIFPLTSGCELTLAHDGVPSQFLAQGERSWSMILASLDQSVRPDS